MEGVGVAARAFNVRKLEVTPTRDVDQPVDREVGVCVGASHISRKLDRSHRVVTNEGSLLSQQMGATGSAWNRWVTDTVSHLLSNYRLFL